MPDYVPEHLQNINLYLRYLKHLPESLPQAWIIVGALLGILLLTVLSRLVSRSRLSRMREAAMYAIGETDRRVGLWLQLHPELAAEPNSLGRQGPLGTRDLIMIVEESGSTELKSRLLTAAQVIISLAVLGAALYVISSDQYTFNDIKWGYGIVGAVIGYWLVGK